ncbi:MAG: CAP domain-containing protein [Myxococcota bacterium]|nr:CAP domain-containing protein [Myxococcota bacterium]
MRSLTTGRFGSRGRACSVLGTALVVTCISGCSSTPDAVSSPVAAGADGSTPEGGSGSGSPLGMAGDAARSGSMSASGNLSASGNPAGSGGASGSGATSTSGATSGSTASSGALDSGTTANDAGSDGTAQDASGPDGSAATCPAPPVGEPAAAIKAVDAVNAVRTRMGVPCVALVPALDVSAQKHCAYYAANSSNATCTGNPHVEVTSCTGFVAAQFYMREAAAGYTAQGASSEVMAFLGDPAGSVQTWIDSVWHRTPVLSPWYRDMGYGGTPAPGACDTIDFGGGAASPNTVTAVYPYAGQGGVPTSFDGSFEGPTPPAPASGWPSGYPVHLYLRGGTVQSHQITIDGTSAPIAHTWIDQTNPTNGRDQYILYADRPLMTNTSYHVVIAATRGTMPLTFDWKFTTGAR